MKPSYRNLLASGELAKRVEYAREALKDCTLCPRNCRVNRLEDEKGFCRTGRTAKVASHNLHQGEEPPITGSRGSGTIFFSNCNLRCIFCQNYPISQLGHGETVDDERLAQMMLNLQKRGAHNINLVTASHVVPQFIGGLKLAAEEGLNIPIVYNSSGYDGLEALELLKDIVDIYMPDLKYVTDEPAERYSQATKYWDASRKAVKEMYEQVGPLQMDEEGIGVRGLLIRHLVLPGGLAGSERVFEFIATQLSPDVPVNLMSQYFPADKAVDDPLLCRRITKQEFAEAEEALHKWKLDNGWIQRM